MIEFISNPAFIGVFCLVVGGILDRFVFVDKESRKLFGAWANAIVLTLEELDLDYSYGEVLTKILTKLHDSDAKSKKAEESITEKLSALEKETKEELGKQQQKPLQKE